MYCYFRPRVDTQNVPNPWITHPTKHTDKVPIQFSLNASFSSHSVAFIRGCVVFVQFQSHSMQHIFPLTCQHVVFHTVSVLPLPMEILYSNTFRQRRYAERNSFCVLVSSVKYVFPCVYALVYICLCNRSPTAYYELSTH